MDFLFILAVGLVAGTLSGIVGFGSSIMLMPVLVIVFGPRQAVPIMAIAAIMVNFSRIVAWWRQVDWRVCAAYSVTGIPGAAEWFTCVGYIDDPHDGTGGPYDHSGLPSR